MAAANQHAASNEVIAYEENGQSVRLVYDTWTPRPHFIIVQCKPKPDASDAELDGTYQIIGHFLRDHRQFDDEAILSFHCGKWYQQHTSKWHAHLCVPQQPYLKEAKTQITEIGTNKEWRGARTVEEGINNWYKRAVANYEKYKNDCVRKRIPEQTSVENVPLSTFSSSEFELVWTSPTPRIGIVALSPSNSNLASLYTFMKSVRVAATKELSKWNSDFANFGCHLCLYVCGQSSTAVTRRRDRVFSKTGTIDENPNIVGYIQMDECQYVQWIPRTLRQIWLKEFREAQHFVRT